MTSIDQPARDLARDALHRIDSHERVCTQRYEALDARLADGSKQFARIEKGVDNVVGILKWGGATLVTTLIAAVGALLLIVLGAK